MIENPTDLIVHLPMYMPECWLFGLHHFAARMWVWGCVQLALAGGGLFGLIVGMNERSAYYETCCYAKPPTAAELYDGGSCADSRSTASQTADQLPCDSLPVMVTVYIGGGFLMFVISMSVFWATRFGYRDHVTRLSELAQENIALFIVCTQPLLCWAAGMHELYTHAKFACGMRILMSLWLIGLVFALIIVRALMTAWSCYIEFSLTLMNIEILNRGRCDDPHSEIYKASATHEIPFWTEYTTIVAMTMGVSCVWIVSLIVRVIGVPAVDGGYYVMPFRQRFRTAMRTAHDNMNLSKPAPHPSKRVQEGTW